MASVKLNEKLMCPNCSKELNFLEEVLLDRFERKTAWACHECDILIYFVEFYETEEQA